MSQNGVNFFFTVATSLWPQSVTKTPVIYQLTYLAYCIVNVATEFKTFFVHFSEFTASSSSEKWTTFYFQKSPFHRHGCTHNHQHIISSLSAVHHITLHPSPNREKKTDFQSRWKKFTAELPYEKKRKGKKCEIKKAWIWLICTEDQLHLCAKLTDKPWFTSKAFYSQVEVLKYLEWRKMSEKHRWNTTSWMTLLQSKTLNIS